MAAMDEIHLATLIRRMGIEALYPKRRLWRSVKYEEVYLKGYESIPEARRELAAYFDFYNLRRRHRDPKAGTPVGVIGLHYRRNEQLHDERSITHEPHEAVQANPATSDFSDAVWNSLGGLLCCP